MVQRVAVGIAVVEVGNGERVDRVFVGGDGAVTGRGRRIRETGVGKQFGNVACRKCSTVNPCVVDQPVELNFGCSSTDGTTDRKTVDIVNVVKKSSGSGIACGVRHRCFGSIDVQRVSATTYGQSHVMP